MVRGILGWVGSGWLVGSMLLLNCPFSAPGLQESPRMGSPPQALNGELESHASSPTEGQPPYRGLASME